MNVKLCIVREDPLTLHSHLDNGDPVLEHTPSGKTKLITNRAFSSLVKETIFVGFFFQRQEYRCESREQI